MPERSFNQYAAEIMQWRAALPVLLCPGYCCFCKPAGTAAVRLSCSVFCPGGYAVPALAEHPSLYRLERKAGSCFRLKVPVTGGCPVMMLPARMAGAAPHPASRLLLPATVTAGRQVPLRLQECLFPPAARDTLPTAGWQLLQLTLRHQ